jgi:hypothetical protein
MGSFWPLFVGMLLSVSAFAVEQANFTFQGQPHEHVTLDRLLVETRTRTEMQDSTCTRQIPYQEEECGYETRYRQECSWIPPRQECGRRDERRCRNVTRYRQECSQGPGQTRCQDFPGGERCTTRNGQRVCEPAPPQRRCETIPGERICRQVPYQDQECTTESVPWCYQVPGENQCRQVPYQEWECRNVTRYRTETYACQRPVEIPYNVNVKVAGQLDVQFLNPNFPQEVAFLATLTAQKTIDLVSSAPAEILVGTRRAAPVVNRQGEEVTVAQRIDVLLTNGAELQGQVAQNVTDAVLDFTAKKLSFTVKGLVEAQDRIELVIEGRRRGVINTIVGRASVKGTISELNAITTSVGENLTAVQIDLANVDTSALNDKKTFLMKLKHVKELSDSFNWVGTVPTLSSDKEASVEAVR